MESEVKREEERSPSRSKWRYTWEAQSEIERIRLILFNPSIYPNKQCRNLHFNVESSFIHVSFTFHGAAVEGEEEGFSGSIYVPIPKRVLLDVEEDSTLSWSYKLMDDHIQLNLLLLLPLHHPLLTHEDFQHPHYDSDLKLLFSGSRDRDDSGVHFYCRNCSANLTNKPIRDFVEMPSADWQEAADNWFGGCCCSFGGISDKLVAQFADSYSLAQGICLLNTMFIVLSKDDFVGCKFPEWDGHQHHEYQAHSVCDDDNIGTICDFGSRDHSHKAHDVDESCEFKGDGAITESLVSSLQALDISANMVLKSDCCADSETETSLTAQVPMKSVVELLEHQKSFLNGFLGNLFMVKSSHLSKDVDWVDFECPQCASVLGAYPCKEGYKPIDGGVRLLKCHVSTSLAVGESDDIFGKYTLERMFTNQLLENAKDEISFRTLVRDMKSKSPSLQLVLLNPNSWCSSGYCTDTAVFMEEAPKPDILPVLKVLFLDCMDTSTSQLRQVEEWAKKNAAEEVYMMKQEIKHLIECLDSAKQSFPPSCAFLQGLPLSYLHR